MHLNSTKLQMTNIYQNFCKQLAVSNFIYICYCVIGYDIAKPLVPNKIHNMQLDLVSLMKFNTTSNKGWLLQKKTEFDLFYYIKYICLYKTNTYVSVGL